MNYVPRKDVEMLWQEMGENKSWENLKDALQKHPEVGQVVDKSMAGKLQMVADRMQKSEFPQSADELADTLRQGLAAYDDEGHPTF